VTAAGLNLAAGMDALARLDDGQDRPGDQQMADQFEAACQAAYDDYQRRIDERERAEWEARQDDELCDEYPTDEPLPLPYAA